ncbi:probable GTP-binding protein OBGM, mitochondrial isoform X1 [Telopea speciosissima]|uniref:probable GTP-binding protein OBGM, mitochondrial isoform X1 n=1 Tax=Telopea speciosissima TaxID=54955 RepID=UPI001CC4A2B6|nr:probable GTP-binding protein OBGM, mitochondrial isoform X1 [Telopea speciosissima]XP_043698475.1 probable GTP-binding protein OBGM, mitochondrial isoform X1 [Telopea speciosissima]
MWLRRITVVPYFGALRRSPRSQCLLTSVYSYSDAPCKKPKLAPLQERRMIDKFRLWAKGGHGGNGCSSFHRSRCDRRGKPDGGNGGRGGNVILECSAAVWDFSNLQHHLNAKKGGHGASKNKIGSRGADKVVQVPVGTTIHLLEGEFPSLIEKSSSTALDPWEIPGELEGNEGSLSTSDRQNTIIPSTTEVLERKDFDVSSSCIESFNKKSPSTLHGVQGSSDGIHARSSPFSKQFKAGIDESVSHSEEGESEDEDVEIGDSMSGEEWEEDEEEEVEIVQYNVAELKEPGQQVVIAQGGEGGLGNVSSAKVSMAHKHMKHGNHKDGAPELELSEDEDQSSPSVGSPGSEAVLILELKSIADVGLVGMPNAGKSTLLGAISRAKPAVGHYAFTTLRPNIGNLNYDDFFSITVADIPGLIKGAHENRGLGHAFLRHIERTKVLAFVVDLAAALDGRKGIPPWEQLRDLVLELEYHQEGLTDRPSLVVANKIDEEGTEDVFEELKRRVQGVPIFPICAVLEEGIPELKAGLRMLMDGVESQRVELNRIMLD